MIGTPDLLIRRPGRDTIDSITSSTWGCRTRQTCPVVPPKGTLSPACPDRRPCSSFHRKPVNVWPKPSNFTSRQRTDPPWNGDTLPPEGTQDTGFCRTCPEGSSGARGPGEPFVFQPPFYLMPREGESIGGQLVVEILLGVRRPARDNQRGLHQGIDTNRVFGNATAPTRESGDGKRGRHSSSPPSSTIDGAPNT